MKKSTDHIIQQIHEIGTHTRRGAFLWSVLRRGLFKTLLFKMLLLITPRRVRVALANGITEESHKTHIDVIVENPENNLLVYMNVVSTYTFLVGSGKFSMFHSLRELHQILRKARWKLAMDGRDCDCEELDTILDMYKDTKVISIP